MWAPYGSHWRGMRKVFVREMMSNTSLEDTYSLRREEVKKTIRDLHSKIGTAVEISQVVFLTEFNMVMSMLWGSTVDSNIATEFQAVTLKILEVLSKPNMSTNREEGFEEDGLLSKGKKDFLQILMEQEDAAMPITLPQLKSMLLVIWLAQLTVFFSFAMGSVTGLVS